MQFLVSASHQCSTQISSQTTMKEAQHTTLHNANLQEQQHQDQMRSTKHNSTNNHVTYQHKYQY